METIEMTDMLFEGKSRDVTRREKKHGEVCHCIGPGDDKLQMYPV